MTILGSILALDIMASGDFLTKDGKKYYFWETTSTGWEPGMLSPETSNKDYWDIALSKEMLSAPYELSSTL